MRKSVKSASSAFHKIKDMTSIIVAIAKNNAIGKDNQLLWHISEDLKYFKRITSGHTVIMGRKTFESIGRPLPNRTNIIISRNFPETVGMTVVSSIEEALQRTAGEEEVFIIGGGSIYREAMPKADRLYITHVDTVCEADTFFPDIDLSQWKEVSREDHCKGENFPHPFSFVVYERK